MYRRHIFIFIIFIPVLSVSLLRGAEPPNYLTINEIIQKVITNNPELRQFQWDLAQGDSEVRELSLFPNPEVDVEIENFGGSKEVKGLSGAEYTFMVGQEIPLKGKRKKRVQAAKMETNIRLLHRDGKKLELSAEAKARFLDILLMQEKIKLRREMLKLSLLFLEKITLRIQAGKASEVEQFQAQVSLSRSRMTLATLEREHKTALLELAGLWGAHQVSFVGVAGQLDGEQVLPLLSDLEKKLAANALLKQLAAETAHLRALVVLARAQSRPNPTVNGGLRWLSDVGSTAFIVSVSMPIPLFNKNRESITRAQYAVSKAQSREKAAHAALLNKLHTLFRQMETAQSNVLMLKETIMPGAAQAADGILKGWQMGKYNYLNVMEAYRTQLEVREEYLENLAALRQSITKLESLTASEFLTTDQTTNQ